jgi:hypothetical protein
MEWAKHGMSYLQSQLLRGRDQEEHGSKPAWAKKTVSETPSQQTSQASGTYL